MIARYRAVSLRTADEQVDPSTARMRIAISAWFILALGLTEAKHATVMTTQQHARAEPAAESNHAKDRGTIVSFIYALPPMPSVASALLTIQLPAAAADLAHRPRLCADGTRTVY